MPVGPTRSNKPFITARSRNCALKWACSTEARGRETPFCLAGTTGVTKDAAAEAGARAKIVAEIKQQLQSEMGLLPVHLLRDRRMSFVELYSSDNLGNTHYGTAGYLGNGYSSP